MDDENYSIIRGEKLLVELEIYISETIDLVDNNGEILTEDETFSNLRQNIQRGFPFVKKRQYATDLVRITSLELVPFVQMKTLMVKAVAHSGESNKEYDVKLLFKNVKYQDQPSDKNITFTAEDKKTYNIIPISLATNTVRVKCTCLDFYFRFTVWNHNKGALIGKPPKPYVRKTTTYPPVNPQKVPGICKHILKTVDALLHAKIVVKQ